MSMVRSNEDRERVRDASDIVRVVGEHLTLKAKGREWTGLCPFHDDHRPSMNVVPGKQIFHCFVCGAGGDVFSFIQKYHKMEFREALEYLAERAGITLSKADREQGTGDKADVTRSDLVRANAAAAEYFRALLRHPEHGRAGREVIGRRAINPAMVEQFGLGVAAARWDGLMLTAAKAGLPVHHLAAAGLVKSREDGGHYDAFRNRLMFPIHDEAGRVIAFGARKIDEADEPKYLNSAETPIFEKRSTLYGLRQASRAIQADRTAIITEGYTDTIACHQAGITNAVATLGTALTLGHAARLRRYCDTVVLLFDGDDAGQRAADRAVEVFIRENLDVKIATLAGFTDAKDPDELLRRDGGVDVLRRAIAGASDLLAYRYQRLRAAVGTGAGPAAITRIVQEELERLVQIGLNELTPLRRRLILRQVAAVAGIDEASIASMVPAGRSAARTAPATPPRTGRSRDETALGILLLSPALWESNAEIAAAILDASHPDAAVQRIASVAAGAVAEHGSCSLAGVLLALGDDTDTKAEAVALTEHVARTLETDELRARALAEMRAGLPGDTALTPNDRLRALRTRDRDQGGNRRVMPRPVPAG
ncbi:MAG: DNA primase [Phycisphaerales bacterium]|nr:DNA primase [Phycisphaerales bacterium]